MKTFTHEQVQEMLRSGAEAPQYDRQGLVGHLSGCAECRSYAALVAELGQAVPAMVPAAPLSPQEIRRKIDALQPRLRRQTTRVRVSRGARTALWVGASLMLVLFLVLIFPRLLPQPIGGNPTPTLTPQPAATATPAPTEVAGGLELSALLKIFPLYPGTRWVYTEENYTQTSDPNQIIHAVTSIADQVADVQNLPPYYIAHIQRETRLVSSDPGWADNGTKTTLGSSEFWYVVYAGRVYRSNTRPDPAAINLDQLAEELDLPLAKDMSWCPQKAGEITPKSQETPVACQYVGSRVVLAEQPFQTQAGSFDACFQLQDVYNTGSIFHWFCDGVGIVAEKFDHAGTPFGYSKELVQFSGPTATATPTPTVTPAPALQISQLATWGKGAITASQFSPDGKRLGVVTTQGVSIYDAASLARLDFIPHAAASPAVAFSPDWSLLALGNGSSVTLLRLADRVEIAHLETDQGKVARLMFSPDGRYLASLVQPPGEEVYTQILNLWGVAEGKLLGTWEAGAMPTLAFAPDSKSIYSWNQVRMVGIHRWQIPSGAPLPVLTDLSPGALAFSPDGKWMALAGFSTDTLGIFIRQVSDGAQVRQLSWEHENIASQLIFSTDGTRVAALSYDGFVQIWRAEDGASLGSFTAGLNGSISSAALTPDGRTLVFSSTGVLVSYNLFGEVGERDLVGFTGSIAQAAFSPQGDRVVALSGDSDPEKSSLEIWAYPQGFSLYTLPKVGALALAWSPQGDRLALGGWDGKVRILRSEDGAVLQTLTGHSQQVQSVAWSPDGTRIASSSFSVKLWQTSDGALLADLGGSGQWIDSLAFSPDGKLLAGADASGKIDIWDLQTKTRVAQLPVTVFSEAQGMAFTPDGQTLVAAEGSNLWFYRLADDKIFLHLPLSSAASVVALAVAPDGAWLACGLSDGSVQIRALPGGELLKTLEGGSDAISSLEFSADGGTLLAASRDGTLRFWEIQQ